MPMRDHFRPPLSDLTLWEGLHGGWPMVIVQHLGRTLPTQYAGAPRGLTTPPRLGHKCAGVHEERT